MLLLCDDVLLARHLLECVSVTFEIVVDNLSQQSYSIRVVSDGISFGVSSICFVHSIEVGL